MILYNLLFPIIYLLMLPKFVFRMCRRGGYAKDFMQRFGSYRADVQSQLSGNQTVWIHAVSVGEMLVALQFAKEIRAKNDNASFVFSTNTSTGHALAKLRKHEKDSVIYYPVDFAWAVKRALTAINPRALLLVENEVWPNMVRQCVKRHIPVYLVNGRLSERSAQGYSLFQKLYSSTCGLLSGVYMQSSADAQRMIELGVPNEIVKVYGSAKYDNASGSVNENSDISLLLKSMGLGTTHPLLVGGSTWPGEEAVLVRILNALQVHHPDVRLVVVPRHMERAVDASRDIAESGGHPMLRSDLKGKVIPGPKDVLIVNTTGELADVYGAADVIFVGKSLLARGGQNMIEPAAMGKAVVVGPHMENFESMLEDVLAENAIVQVKDEEGLQKAIQYLFDTPSERKGLGKRAARLVDTKKGSIAKVCEEITLSGQ